MKRILRLGLSAVLVAVLAAAVSCSKDDTEKPDPTPPPSSSDSDSDLNEWMFGYMKTHYLWNSAVKKVGPDYSLGYEEFLAKVLDDVAAQNDINHDDGHWEGGRRQYFYSNIQRYKTTASAASKTRGTRETEEGTGIQYMNIFYIENGKEACMFELLAVSPGSPADAKGLKRGTIITRINGTVITDSNYAELTKVLMPAESGKTVRLTTASFNDEDKLVETPGEITVVSASFDDNPVWMTKILTAKNGTHKIGYLCYKSFNLYYDEQLMEAFAEFKSQSVKDLILDLRYNGGGHVVSSLLLGTMIAGPAKAGEVYSKETYNAERAAKGETDNFCKIGDKNVFGGIYSPIADGIGDRYALGLGTVYVLCTNNTASASELIVNGLRGVDVEVRLIGQTTNGKNVGMEPVTKDKDGYTYEFSPITFYSENAKGFKDYSEGFTPDVVIDEGEYYPREWGSEEDPLLAAALKWIDTGSKPSVKGLRTVRSAAAGQREVLKAVRRSGGLEGMILLRGLDK